MTAGRPRAPLARLEASGALKKNPSYYRNRGNEPKSSPLGKPSPNLTKREVEMWKAIRREAWWLCEGDRALVEFAAKLRAKSFTKKGLDLKEGRFYVSVLRTLGMSPIDRSRIQLPDDNSQTSAPEDEFLN